jgi:hypothetical protein
MLLKDFVATLKNFDPDKQVLVMQAHMDPFYYDSSDTVANAVLVVTDDEGTIFEVIETDTSNEIIDKQEIECSSLGVDVMVVGNRYKIYHMSGTERSMRTSVMDYLGRELRESHHGEGSNYLFNARPVAGTQSMPPSWIKIVEPVSKDTPIVLNKIVPR